MPTLTLRTAVGNYGHTKPLKDGSATAQNVALDHVEVSPVISIFRRMVRGLEFDVAEMALSTYLCSRAHNKPFTAIPIFLVRGFHHGAIQYNTNSGIQSPKDLEGRRVGVRGYTVTTGVWVRGHFTVGVWRRPKQGHLGVIRRRPRCGVRLPIERSPHRRRRPGIDVGFGRDRRGYRGRRRRLPGRPALDPRRSQRGHRILQVYRCLSNQPHFSDQERGNRGQPLAPRGAIRGV